MSPPDTNIEKQKKNHRPSLFGIGGGIAFIFVLLLVLIVWVIMNGGKTEGPSVQPDDTATVPATTE